MLPSPAHLVGFYDDRQRVIHIHPSDAEPQRATDRGGPALTFRLYAPRSGFVRLFCQTQVAGAAQFPTFGLNVADSVSPPPGSARGRSQPMLPAVKK